MLVSCSGLCLTLQESCKGSPNALSISVSIVTKIMKIVRWLIITFCCQGHEETE